MDVDVPILEFPDMSERCFEAFAGRFECPAVFAECDSIETTMALKIVQRPKPSIYAGQRWVEPENRVNRWLGAQAHGR